MFLTVQSPVVAAVLHRELVAGGGLGEQGDTEGTQQDPWFSLSRPCTMAFRDEV